MLQRDKTGCDELYLGLDTLPIRSTNNILLLYTGFHVKDFMYVLCELITQFSVLVKRQVRDLDSEFFCFGYRSSRNVMCLSEGHLMSADY